MSCGGFDLPGGRQLFGPDQAEGQPDRSAPSVGRSGENGDPGTAVFYPASRLGAIKEDGLGPFISRVRPDRNILRVGGGFEVGSCVAIPAIGEPRPDERASVSPRRALGGIRCMRRYPLPLQQATDVNLGRRACHPRSRGFVRRCGGDVPWRGPGVRRRPPPEAVPAGRPTDRLSSETSWRGPRSWLLLQRIVQSRGAEREAYPGRRPPSHRRSGRGPPRA